MEQETESTLSVETELDNLREGVDDPMVLKEQLRKESEARRQLTARAKAAEEKLREVRAELKAASPEAPITNEQPQTQVPLNDEVVDLRLDGYSKQEVEWIMKNGGRKVLDDPNSLVSIAIKAQREQLAADRASSDTTSTVGLSEIERKYTPEQLRNMSVKELEAILPHAN